ncbi:Amino acid permease [Chitinispirillum alkaliphilum]|nr:Amino acid permease [Chitinispirillum alkaliphilum]
MKGKKKLKRRLGLFDVFAISTGAMFSSGFFLLPGIAAAQTGPSVFLAYLLAALIMVPPMLSMAELSTAMPQAGGAYFFLDRSLGHFAGTVGGIGTYIVLILKGAFAFAGIGAYIGIVYEIPTQSLAVSLALVFGLINYSGAKHSTGVQKILVIYLLTVMCLFLFQATQYSLLHAQQFSEGRFQPLFPFGFSGLFAATGTVFISYAGLTKVASLAEEVKNPDTTIPAGMILSLLVTTIVYTGGVYMLVTILSPDQLQGSFAPVAEAGEKVMGVLPLSAGVLLVILAAVAAFISTGNAGILSSSRYPLAMARDRLVPPYFSNLNRFKIPGRSVVITTVLMVAAIVFIDIEQIAKLASSFQLLVFAIINASVIVMRKARIEGYRPGFRSPLFPWIQIFGIAAAFFLIFEIGLMQFTFSISLILVSSLWYTLYTRKKATPQGAVYHLKKPLNKPEGSRIGQELLELLKIRDLFPEDNFDSLVINSAVIDLSSHHPGKITPALLEKVVPDCIANITGTEPRSVKKHLFKMEQSRITAMEKVVILESTLHVQDSHLLLVRFPSGFEADPQKYPFLCSCSKPISALLVVVSKRQQMKKHLRIVGELLRRSDNSEFVAKWVTVPESDRLRELLL